MRQPMHPAKHGGCPGRMLLTWLALLACTMAHAAPRLRVVDPAHALLAPGAGTRLIHFAVSEGTIPAGARLTVRLQGYGADGVNKVANGTSDVAQATTEQRAGQRRANDIAVRLNVPRIGFFALDAQLSSASGQVIATEQTHLAAIPVRTHLGPPDFGVGANLDQGENAPTTLLPIIRNAGFSWVRAELSWDGIEPRPGVFTFPAQFDESMRLASSMGITTLVLLDYGNAAAYPRLFKKKASFPMTAAAREQFVRYVQQVVGRYGKEVNAWEVWNEPHFQEIGYGTYVALLKAVYPEIKKLAPHAQVVSCGGDWGGNPIDACIDAIIRAGALQYQDGFSIHPYMYPSTPEVGYEGPGTPVTPVSVETVWPYLKRFIARHPKANGQLLQLWVSEIGWPSAPYSAQQSAWTQAANLARTYLISRRYGVARGVCWYDLVDDGTDPTDKESNFGLLRADLSPKPAFVAAAVLASTLEARPWQRALVDSARVKVYAYGTDSTVIAGWTVAGAQVVHVSLPPGDYLQRDWDGRETSVHVGADGLDWHVGPLPRYLMARPPA